MTSKMRRKIFALLVLLSTFLLPISSQLFDDSDVKDPQGVLDHFRSRIKQVGIMFFSDYISVQALLCRPDISFKPQ